jgi:hypothetical protein
MVNCRRAGAYWFFCFSTGTLFKFRADRYVANTQAQTHTQHTTGKPTPKHSHSSRYLVIEARLHGVQRLLHHFHRVVVPGLSRRGEPLV